MSDQVVAGQGMHSVNKVFAEARAKPAGLEWANSRENSWVGFTASQLGSKCLCRVASYRWLCVYDEGQGRKMAPLFPERFPTFSEMQINRSPSHLSQVLYKLLLLSCLFVDCCLFKLSLPSLLTQFLADF